MALSQQMLSMFGNLKGTKPVVDATYFSPGHYWCRIDQCKEGKTRKQVMFLAFETTVVKVIREEPGRSHRPGATPTKMLMSDDADYFLPELVTALGAIFNMNPQEVGVEEAMAAFDDSQPLRNMVVEVEAKEITTKANTLFTKIMFKREVPPGEVLACLTPQEKNMFFPNNYLENMIQAIQQQQQQPPQA